MACRAVARQSEGWSARDEWASQAFQDGCPKRASSLSRAGMHVQGCLILSQVGLLFPVNHAPLKLASLTGFAPVISYMRGRRVGLDYTTGTELVRAERFALST